MQGGPARDRLRGLGVELRISRAAQGPERLARRRRIEREHLFHAAVAVRRDDNHLPRWDPEEEIVVELALCPVLEDLEAARARPELLERSTEHERSGEIGDELVHALRNIVFRRAWRKR